MRTFDYLKYAMVMFCCVLGMSFTSCDDDDDDKKTGSLKVSTNKIEMAPGAKSNVTVRGGTAPYTASVRTPTSQRPLSRTQRLPSQASMPALLR